MRTHSTRGMSVGVMLLVPCLAYGQTAIDEGAGASRFVDVERMDPPAAAGARWINLSASGDGLLASWIEPSPDDPPTDGRDPMRMRFSRWDGQTWSEPTTVVAATNLFVNWADYPSVTAGGDGSIVAHWPERTGEATYAYDVQLARSTDGGRSWTRLGPAHDDATETEHGFVSFVPDEAGLRAFWLDGRETSGGMHGKGQMTLRTAIVSDEVRNGERIDASVCDCCDTAAAMTSLGPIVVYRDRTWQEVRDISIARLTSRGWSKPKSVHDDGWKIAACPVNGPAVAAEDRRVAVVWYTAADPGPRVLVAFSDNAGATFDEPIVVDAAGPPHGRVGVVLDSGGDAIVTWLDSAEPEAAVRVRRVARSGRIGEALTVLRTTARRTSGFPVIVRDGAWAYLAWTVDHRRPSVAVCRFALQDIP